MARISENWLIEPSFHDGYLDGIRVARNLARLHLRTVEGDRFALIRTGVEAFVANDFREGNIVFGVHIYLGTNLPSGALDQLYPSPHPTASQEYHDHHTSSLLAIERAVGSGQKMCVEVQASYGCTQSALCDISSNPKYRRPFS